MTDQQRGAYTPQEEMPLKFDPRTPSAKRPLPLALLASGALLLVMIGAVALYYSRGVRADNEPPRPVGEPVAALKTAPAAGAQPADPAAGLDVGVGSAARAPAFAPAPEAPKPRQAVAVPRSLTVQTLPAAEMARAAPPIAPVPFGVIHPAPATAPARRASAETSLAAAGTPAPTPAETAPPAPPRAQAAALGAGADKVRVQIGAFSTAALADRGWSDVAALLPQAIAGKSKDVEPVRKGDQTLYRTAVAGFPDRAAAAAFCESLKAKGKICFVKS